MEGKEYQKSFEHFSERLKDPRSVPVLSQIEKYVRGTRRITSMEAIRGLTREQQSGFIQKATAELNNSFKDIWSIVKASTS